MDKRTAPFAANVTSASDLSPRDRERFWARVERDDDGLCWTWRGYVDRDGYGRFYLRGTSTGAHRAAYVLMRGAVHQGLVIDHLCRNRGCVNPWHMEPVTNAVNAARGRVGLRPDVCQNGHPRTVENTKILNGRNVRYCRECIRQAKARYRARLRAAA